MEYIIVRGKTHYVARDYFSRFMVRDYFAPLGYVYGGRITASQALTFGTLDDARSYAVRNNLTGSNYSIAQYDVYCNNVKTQEVAPCCISN